MAGMRLLAMSPPVGVVAWTWRHRTRLGRDIAGANPGRRPGSGGTISWGRTLGAHRRPSHCVAGLLLSVLLIALLVVVRPEPVGETAADPSPPSTSAPSDASSGDAAGQREFAVRRRRHVVVA